MADTPFPRESPELQEAHVQLTLAVRRIQVLAGRRLPPAATLGDFLSSIRHRGDDTYFLSENPGP